MSEITPAFIKGLFHHLVKSVGGNEAAGAYLEISHQRVSQLKQLNCADMPTIMQVVTLEAAVGRSVVFDALSRSVAGQVASDNLLKEACELTESAVDFQRSVRSGAPLKEIEAAAARVMREASDIPPALSIITGGRA